MFSTVYSNKDAGVYGRYQKHTQISSRALRKPGFESGVVGSEGGGWAVGLLPTGLVSFRRHLEPCMRSSRTRRSDVLRRPHSAPRPPGPCRPWRDDGSVDGDEAHVVR